MRHACSKCGFRHKSPTVSTLIISLVAGALFLVVEVFAALALDGWLSVGLWIIAGLHALRIVFTVYGMAILATNAMKGELP